MKTCKEPVARSGGLPPQRFYRLLSSVCDTSNMSWFLPELQCTASQTRAEILVRLITSCPALQVGAAVLGVRVKPTIKEVKADGLVVRTLERASLWEVQTPQVRGCLSLSACAEQEPST